MKFEDYVELADREYDRQVEEALLSQLTLPIYDEEIQIWLSFGGDSVRWEWCDEDGDTQYYYGHFQSLQSWRSW